MYGKILKELRKEKGWTQTQLAEKLNIKTQAISKYELERLDLSTEMIGKICNLFEISADYLLGLKDE